jgi:hypothetical protein
VKPRALLLLLGTLLLPALLFAAPPASDAVNEQGSEKPLAADVSFPRPQFQFQGTASCAAAACHNAPGAKGSLGSEYSTWISHDKHARAYEVLFDERSKRILQNYKGSPLAPREESSPLAEREGYLVRRLEDAHPEREALCLKCHVHPHWDRLERPTQTLLRQDGVSCESCHGPAEKWLGEHFRPSWREKSATEKQRDGMHDTDSILGRAGLCVACHVGSSAAEVNHDLIAAGHPRLRFEFAAYHARMPHHWPDVKDKDPALGGRQDFEAQAWALGQLVSAQQALRLLADRARDERSPWPEFAEYDCYACHHDLKAKSWRQESGYKGRTPGSLPWSDWYVCLPIVAVEGLKENGRPLQKALAKVRLEMQRGRPERGKIAGSAATADGELQRLLVKLTAHEAPSSQFPVADTFRQLLDKEMASLDASWDGAAQHYLVLAALHHAGSDLRLSLPARTTRSLGSLSNFLSDPSRFTPKTIEERLKNLRPPNPR